MPLQGWGEEWAKCLSWQRAGRSKPVFSRWGGVSGNMQQLQCLRWDDKGLVILGKMLWVLSPWGGLEVSQFLPFLSLHFTFLCPHLKSCCHTPRSLFALLFPFPKQTQISLEVLRCQVANQGLEDLKPNQLYFNGNL